MEIEWVDEKKQYVYDVTGKLNLKQYLEKDGIGKHKVKKVMECLLSLPERLESYLLDGNDVRILPDCIFVDKHSEEVYGIYYPGNDCYGMTAYAAVAEFIIDHMNQKDTELAFFVYGLHKRFLEEGMTLVALREYMDSDSHVETDFAKEEDKWVNTDDREMPLNQTLVSSLVNNIAGITTESVVEQPEDLSEYGLDNPVRTIKATLENGSSIIIYVGNQNDLTGDYYIRLEGDDRVYGISSYVVTAFDKEPEEFIEETEEETTSAEDTEETAADTANAQETE